MRRLTPALVAVAALAATAGPSHAELVPRAAKGSTGRMGPVSQSTRGDDFAAVIHRATRQRRKRRGRPR